MLSVLAIAAHIAVALVFGTVVTACCVIVVRAAFFPKGK